MTGWLKGGDLSWIQAAGTRFLQRLAGLKVEELGHLGEALRRLQPPGITSLERLSGHNQLGNCPMAVLEPAEGTVYTIWPGNTWGYTKRNWKSLPETGMSGTARIVFCPDQTDDNRCMDGTMLDLRLFYWFTICRLLTTHREDNRN